jgi:hypothetical protein
VTDSDATSVGGCTPLSEAFAWSAVDLAPPASISPGVERRVLWHDEYGAVALVLTLAAAARVAWCDALAADVGEIFVVRGSMHDDARTYRAGSFLHVTHARPRSFASVDGAHLFVFAPARDLGLGSRRWLHR